MSGPRIDIVSDVICPWCFIGSKRVDLALAASGISDASITFHAFLLDPSLPPDGEDLRERLARKYGVAPEQMFERVEAAARESGIALDFTKVRRMPNTLKAHTLIARARAHGTQAALARGLFEAYFLEGRDVGDDEVLADVASAHGFSRDEARAATTDQAALAATRSEAIGLSRQGIQGVPLTIVDGRYAVNGAQPVEVFQQTLETARRARG